MDQLPATFNQNQIAPAFANGPDGKELGAGIQSSFGIVSYRGKVWAIKYQGNETPLMREDGDGAKASIEAIIVKASPSLSKIFYEQGFVDGSNAPPDCFSTNGEVPDPAAPKKQSTTCAGCPKNAFGSKITDAGKQSKACADSKRLVIVPTGDMKNELFGGPMLLRCPAASLKDLKSFGDTLGAAGFQYYAVSVKISFDVSESYPKFVLTPVRPLTQDEALEVLALRDDPRVQRILSEAVDMVKHEPAAGATVTPEAAKPAASMFSSAPPAQAQPEPAQQNPPISQATPVVEDEEAKLERMLAEAKARKEAKAKAELEAKTAAAAVAAAPKLKSKADELREQLAAMEAEEAAANAKPAALQPVAQAAQPTGEPTSAPAPADFESKLDALLPK